MHNSKEVKKKLRDKNKNNKRKVMEINLECY